MCSAELWGIREAGRDSGSAILLVDDGLDRHWRVYWPVLRCSAAIPAARCLTASKPMRQSYCVAMTLLRTLM